MSNYIFNFVPTIKAPRSQQDLSHIVKTSGNVGTLYPFDVQEVVPGDSFKCQTNIVSRLTSTFLRPVVDNLFMDIYHFFVPSRTLYDKFVNIFGENTESAWANTKEYEVPNFNTGGVVITPKTVGHYLGLPVSSGDISNKTISSNVPLSVLPFRAFAKIYEEWFRDQNNISPMHLQTGELAESEKPNSLSWAPNNYFGFCPKVAKLHDYFTSSLPAPQKGPSVQISPFGTFSDTPVVFKNTMEASPAYQGNVPAYLFNIGGSSQLGRYGSLYVDYGSGPDRNLGDLTSEYSGGAPLSSPLKLAIQNAWAKTSDLSVPSVTVNDLRLSVQYQKMLERDARNGSRFIEYLRAAFGVNAPNAELQRSEFLGGRRIPISITQVTQTTGAGSETSPLGDVGAYSLSGGKSYYNKGFVEPGYVISCFCIRQFHTYQQGVERFWTRTKRTDFYDPLFQSIGEQPVYKSELYAFKETSDERLVFGYQAPWNDLRYRQNRISGQLSSGITDSLEVWHFGDFYTNAPTLNEQFINETSAYVDRAISVESSVQDQFLIDFYMKVRAYRRLPANGVPSLLDHH